MASYTIELRKICELYGRDEVENWFKSYNLSDFLTQEQISQITKYNVWSKEKLATKIVDHYFMREIGLETPALFAHYAKVTMNEIMEEYLLKIYTKFLEYDPLSSVDYEEKYTREINTEHENKENSNLTTNNSINSSTNTTNSGTNNNTSSASSSSSSSSSSENTTNNENSSENTTTNSGNSTSSSSNNSSGLTVHSDTPQGQISKNTILQGQYASDVSASETTTSINDTTSTSNNGSSSITSTNDTTSSSSSETNEENEKNETSTTTLSNTENSQNTQTNVEKTTNNSSNNGNSKTLETYTHTMKGDNGVIVTNQYLIREFRELAINFDLEIIVKLNTLFMGIY